jgi:hypothetical protein
MSCIRDIREKIKDAIHPINHLLMYRYKYIDIQNNSDRFVFM